MYFKGKESPSLAHARLEKWFPSLPQFFLEVVGFIMLKIGDHSWLCSGVTPRGAQDRGSWDLLTGVTDTPSVLPATTGLTPKPSTFLSPYQKSFRVFCIQTGKEDEPKRIPGNQLHQPSLPSSWRGKKPIKQQRCSCKNGAAKLRWLMRQNLSSTGRAQEEGNLQIIVQWGSG